MIEIDTKGEIDDDILYFKVVRNKVEIGRIKCLKDSTPIFLSEGYIWLEAEELLKLLNKIRGLDAVRLRKARERQRGRLTPL